MMWANKHLHIVNDIEHLREEIFQRRHELNEMEWEKWRYHEIFDPLWWLLLVSAVLPWFIWWRYVDRSRFKEILIYGLLWAGTAFLLDGIGLSTGLWNYPRMLFYSTPPMFPADGTVIPILFMFAYQFVRSEQSFFVASMTASALLSYAAEPLFVYLNLYEPQRWSSNLSLVAFLALGYLLRWLNRWINKERVYAA